jgi:hypothetical protein
MKKAPAVGPGLGVEVSKNRRPSPTPVVLDSQRSDVAHFARRGGR